MIRSLIAASRGWIFGLFFCWSSDHCCLITVMEPKFSILVSLGRYILNTEVLVLCSPSRATVVHLPNPGGSSPLEIIVDDMYPSAMMVVPPSL